MNNPPESHKCRACRRPLTSEVSLKHGFGPDCLRKAVKAGNVPLEALEEFTAWKKANPKPRQAKPLITSETHSPDLFAKLREQAIQALHAAAEDCRAVGVTLKIEIQ